MLLPPNLPPNFVPKRVFIDWDYSDLTQAPDFSQGYDEITSYVTDVSITIGNTDPDANIASIGTCSIKANNETQIFSSENTSGLYYGKIVQDKPVRVQVYDTTTGTIYTIFQGKVANINPGTGVNRKPQATFDCVDILQDIQDTNLDAIPLQLNKTTDVLAKIVVNAALDSPMSSAIEVFAPVSAYVGKTVTINGRVYTFTSTNPPTIVDTVYTSQLTEGGMVAKALATAINVGDTNLDFAQGYLFAYASGQTIHADVSALANPDSIFKYGPSDVPSTFGQNMQFGQGSGGLFHKNATILAGSSTLGTVADTPGVSGPQGTIFQTPAANGDSWQHSFTISYAATYNIRIAGSKNSDCGKLDIYIDNVFNQTLDFYNASLSTGTLLDISIALSAGTHTIKGIVNGKNASSSGFFIRMMNPTNNSSFIGFNVVNGIAITTGLLVLQARVKGTASNVVVSTSSSDITVANLTGGLDMPNGLTSYDSGVQTIAYAGDGWQDQNALSALTSILNAEYGWLFVQRDGTLTFKNSHSWFLAEDISLANLTMVDQGYLVSPGINKADLKTRIRLKYTPRALLASGVVAKNNAAVTVPGQSGTDRWNGNVVLPGGGNVVVQMKAVDPTTGQPMAVQSFITPLAPGTDYDVSDDSNGNSGANYNNSPHIKFTIALNADNVQVSIKNTALGPLYVGPGTLHKLQIRGIGVVKYNPLTIIQDNSAQQTLHGIRIKDVQIPLQIPDTFAYALTQYMLNRYSTPIFNTKGVDFQDQRYVNGVFLPSLQLGNTIQMSDSQTGLANKFYMIVGANYELAAGGVCRVKFILRRMANQFYWKLGNTTYGKLGTNTRLGL